MEYLEFRPPPALARHLRCFWNLRGAVPPRAVFPDGRLELVFHLGAPVLDAGAGLCQPRSMVVGQMLAPVSIAAIGTVDAFGIRLQPAAAPAILRLPPVLLTGRMIAAADWDPAARELQERLGALPHPADRARCAAAWLLARLPADPDPFAEHWASLLLAGAGDPSTSLSPRQARRRFAAATGIGPKLFARLARFQRSLRLLDGLPPAFAAAEAGYADQAHFAREFREFSGMTPRQWLQGNDRFLQDSIPRFDDTDPYATLDSDSVAHCAGLR